MPAKRKKASKRTKKRPAKKRAAKKRAAKKRPAKKKAPAVKAVADSLRDLKNWLYVYEEDYDLPARVVSSLHKKIDAVGSKLRRL